MTDANNASYNLMYFVLIKTVVLLKIEFGSHKLQNRLVVGVVVDMFDHLDTKHGVLWSVYMLDEFVKGLLFC